jgi:hypothetical protein
VNQIAPIRREDRLPAIHVGEIDRDLYSVVMFWEGGGVGSGTPVLRRPFNASERAALERRVWELGCAVAPFEDSNREVLLQAITGMLGAFPMMQRFDQSTALGIVAGYLWTARERPHWAIVKACERVRSGNAGLNASYCPSEPEFNNLISRLVEPYVNALRRAENLMMKKIEPPAPPRHTHAGSKLEARTGMPAGDGKRAERVMADLAARRDHKVDAAVE